MALRAQARGFKPHRAAARANVPHAAVGTQLHAGQRHGAHLLLGDEAFVGLALVVGAVGQAHAHGLRAHLAAHQHHHVGVGKGLLRGVVR